MQRKRGVSTSEPAMMLDVMERCPEWSVVVVLVGGGQEIHNGEAGLSEWGRALTVRATILDIEVSGESFRPGRAKSLGLLHPLRETSPWAEQNHGSTVTRTLRKAVVKL